MLFDDRKLVSCPFCYEGYICVQFEFNSDYKDHYERWEECPECHGSTMIEEQDLVMLKLQGIV